MNEPKSITIIYDELEFDRGLGEKGLFATKITQTRKIGELDAENLAETLKKFCSTIGKTFQGATTAIDDYELKTFELNVDVTAKGEIRFIGSFGTELKGGLKLIFERKPKP